MYADLWFARTVLLKREYAEIAEDKFLN